MLTRRARGSSVTSSGPKGGSFALVPKSRQTWAAPLRRAAKLLRGRGPVAALAGCGTARTQPGGFTYETTLTVYSALALQGPQGALMHTSINDEILALAQGRRPGRNGGQLRLAEDAPQTSGGWDGKEPRAAGQDLGAIAYIGDLRLGRDRDHRYRLSTPTTSSRSALGAPRWPHRCGLPRPTGRAASFLPTGQRALALPCPVRPRRGDSDGAVHARPGRQAALRCSSDRAPASAPYDWAIAALVRLRRSRQRTRARWLVRLRQGRVAPRARAARGACASAPGRRFSRRRQPAAAVALEGVACRLPALRLFAPSTLATARSFAPSHPPRRAFLTSPILPIDRYPPVPGGRAMPPPGFRHPRPLSPYGYEAMCSILAAISHARDLAKRLAVLAAYRNLGR